jgi:hypothetical protein
MPVSTAPQSLVVVLVTTLCLQGAAGCLLYTDPINSPPQVEIVSPLQVMRGQPAVFFADARDPDNDPLTIEWSLAPGACPAPAEPTLRPPTTGVENRFTVIPDPKMPSTYCVWVRVRDRHGASIVRNASVTAGNSRPEARMEVQQPTRNLAGNYDLYSTIRISGAASTDADQDELIRRWTMRRSPDISQAALHPCSPSSPEDLAACFSADVPGTYEVELVVSDIIESSEPEREILIVDPDKPPCIGTVPPHRLVLDPTTAREFRILEVRDDGDPFPYTAQSQLRFFWSLRREMQAWQTVPGHALLNAVRIEADTFAVGDLVAIRVEVQDRQKLPPAGCGDADSCPLTGDCVQRVTWNLEYR